MGVFIEAVRRGQVVSPFRLGFDLRKWIEEGTRTIDGEIDDLELFAAGVLFHEKLTRLWTRFGAIHLERYSGEKLRRAYVALVNRDFATLRGKIETKFENFAKQEVPYMEEMLTTKISGAINGCDYSADDVAASSVDGLHMPLRKTFETRNEGAGKLDIEDILQGVLLGQLHSFTTGVWDDCLWSHHKLLRRDKVTFAVPTDEARSRARAIGHARMVKLQTEMNYWGIHFWRRMTDAERWKATGYRCDVKITGTGRRINIKVSPAELDPRMPATSFSLRIVASEIYFRELFETELPKLPGVTPTLLLSAWELLYALADAIAAQLPTESAITKPSDLWEFAPILPRLKLCQLLVDGLRIPFDLSRSIVQFVTFSADQSEELWARPFVQLDSATVTPVLICIHDPNPLRMVEKWMRYGGLELQSRGDAFESHAREQLARCLKNSRWLTVSGICPHRYKLPRFGNDDPGDIDLIAWFGDTVLIGELKCNLFPARASEFHNYFVDLEKAGSQISRKEKAFEMITDRFWREIAKRDPPSQTRVIPLILSNLPVGVGLKFNGVPVTDLLILGRFLEEGCLQQFVKLDPTERPTAGENLDFYQTGEEAEKVVSEYLADPPQLHHLRDGIASVQNVLPKADADDTPLVILDYEVQLDSIKLETRRSFDPWTIVPLST